ncbi:MAG: phage gp6-like head-tail connector protein [Proteobacteria bacterium]|nr:phage gp6-like head-tail connector protein [Pseudomonadota bacterium]
MAYVTLPELRAYLNMTGTGDDVLLRQLIDSAQQNVDRYCGWQFEAHTATRYYDSEADVDPDQRSVLVLDEPLLTVTTLTNGDADVLIPAEYFLEPTNSVPKWRIRLRASTGLYWTYTTDHEQAITLVGTWGYMATADYAIKQATMRWAGYLYKQRDAQVFDVTASPAQGQITIPQGIPRDVERILAPYRRLC